MGYLLDLPELLSLKLEIGNNRDQVFHFSSQEGKWQHLNSTNSKLSYWSF